MAVLYGADAVYLAGESFGMRSFAGNFSREELPRAVRFAHEHGVRVHVTINTMPRNREADSLPAWLEVLDGAGVDALIVADMGAFALAGRYAPRCDRHISTQASVSNYQTALAWHELGARRVILARELSLEEIREIRPVPAQQLYDRPGRQPGGLRPALPVSVLPYGGEAARRILPRVRGRGGDVHYEQPGHVHD